MAKSRVQKRKVVVNALDQINPNAAGIDIGGEEIYVAVPPDRDEESVRWIGVFTEDLERLADWLKACRVDTVAMEATGVYSVSYTHLRAHETRHDLVCRLLLEKKKKKK